MILPRESVDRRSISDLFEPAQVPGVADTVVRALKIIGTLQSEPRSFEALREKTGIPKRTLRRYLARLRSAGFKIRYSRVRNLLIYTGFDADRRLTRIA